MIDRYLRPLLHRLRWVSNNPKAIEDIMALPEDTKELLFRALQDLENESRNGRNRRW